MTRSIPSSLAGLFVLCLIGCGRDDAVPGAKKEARPDLNPKYGVQNKIVGTWTFVKASNKREPTWGMTLEFSADGKVALRGPGYSNSGKYVVEHGLLKFTAAPLDEKLAIIKLNDKEMVLDQKAPAVVRFEYQRAP